MDVEFQYQHHLQGVVIAHSVSDLATANLGRSHFLLMKKGKAPEHAAPQLEKAPTEGWERSVLED